VKNADIIPLFLLRRSRSRTKSGEKAMARCNYCNFVSIREEHKNSDKTVTLTPDNHVYVHPKEIIIADLSKEEREKYFVAWFMELPNYCCC